MAAKNGTNFLKNTTYGIRDKLSEFLVKDNDFSENEILYIYTVSHSPEGVPSMRGGIKQRVDRVDDAGIHFKDDADMEFVSKEVFEPTSNVLLVREENKDAFEELVRDNKIPLFAEGRAAGGAGQAPAAAAAAATGAPGRKRSRRNRRKSRNNRRKSRKH